MSDPTDDPMQVVAEVHESQAERVEKLRLIRVQMAVERDRHRLAMTRFYAAERDILRSAGCTHEDEHGQSARTDDGYNGRGCEFCDL